jgi:hypothetical protein
VQIQSPLLFFYTTNSCRNHAAAGIPSTFAGVRWRSQPTSDLAGRDTSRDGSSRGRRVRIDHAGSRQRKAHTPRPAVPSTMDIQGAFALATSTSRSSSQHCWTRVSDLFIDSKEVQRSEDNDAHLYEDRGRIQCFIQLPSLRPVTYHSINLADLPGPSKGPAIGRCPSSAGEHARCQSNPRSSASRPTYFFRCLWNRS